MNLYKYMNILPDRIHCWFWTRRPVVLPAQEYFKESKEYGAKYHHQLAMQFFFYVTFVDIFHIIVLIYPIYGDYVNDIFYTKCFVKNEEIQLHNQPIKQLPSAKWCPLRYARLSRHMSAWRHHDMWTVSTLLALCGGMHQSSMDQIEWSFILSLI